MFSRHPNRRTHELLLLQVTSISVGRLRSHHRLHIYHTRAQNTTTLTTSYCVYFLAGQIRPQTLHVVLYHLNLQHTLTSASRPVNVIINKTLRVT